MWKAASILLVLTVCAGSTWASPYHKKCNKGPEYWCSNYRTAEECNAVGHCAQTVWTKQKYAVDTDLVANKFTKLFEQLRQRHSEYNEEQLQSILDAACHSVPHVAAGLKCKEYLAGLAPEVKTMLSTDSMSPTTICSVLALCNNPKMDLLLASPKHTKTDKAGSGKEHFQLLGSERCTWGPSYWCANIRLRSFKHNVKVHLVADMVFAAPVIIRMLIDAVGLFLRDSLANSHDCRATKHCIKRVWSKTAVAVDSDDICKICTDMVKQARDQLESNETQEELKEVFEGSCKLIPIKVVSKECMKLADDFVPELVETLASEMNPQQVCTVAGLCNSERIDKLIAQYEEYKGDYAAAREECGGCRKVVGLLRNNFDGTEYEHFLENLLKGCRNLGSFSDSCSMLVFAHFEEILEKLREHMTPDNVCHLSGQCAYMYHNHEDDYVRIELTNSGSTGVLKPTDDDLPCEMCEQLVKHLRDVIIANTTESEFFTVLKGICKQTGNFKDECLTLVEQWYPVIYNYLISSLKPNEVCALGGICPGVLGAGDVPIAPLISSELIVKAITPSSKLIGNDERNSYKMSRVGVSSQQSSVRVLGTERPPPLPIERMFVQLPQNKGECALCQYVLHYIQVEISDTRNEANIKAAVERMCKRLPTAIGDSCTQFVEAYGPAMIALLVQEIDPASVCPELNICPKVSEIRRVSISASSSSCPLCLFAVEQLDAVLKENRTEAKIRNALENLCNSLSEKLKPQCVDFVDSYTNQLVEMLLADLNAKEICVYLKCCKDETIDPLSLRSESAIDKFHSKPHLRGDRNRMRKRPVTTNSAGIIETNEIADTTYNGHRVQVRQKSTCVICEFVMKEIDGEIKDKKNVDDIKRIVHGICDKMPKSVSSECNQFVDKYADIVIALLAQELDADEVCREIKLCDPTEHRKQLKENILDCAVCETVIMAVDKVLANPNVDHKVVHVLEKACNMLPAKYYDRCHTLLEIYGDSIIHLIEQYGTKGVCQKIGMCGGYEGAYVQMFRERN